MKWPRIGIIGAGDLATRRIYPYIGAAGGMLVAVCDIDEEKAKANAERFGARAVYTDFKKMLLNEKLDGVIVCIGPEMHASMAPQIMKAGIPVYTEKPPGPTAADVKKVVEVSRETGVLCMTAFKKRYARCYQRAKKFIESPEFGEKELLSMDYASGPYSNESPRWFFLLDFALHIIDLTRFLFGEVSEVYALSRQDHSFAVTLHFGDGALGNLSFTDRRSWTIPTEEVEITGSNGSFITIHNSSSYKLYQKGQPIEFYEPCLSTSAGDSGIETGHLVELQAFFRALAGEERPVSTIEESYKSMILYEAILNSARTGQAIKLGHER
jgi:UDP-N-acetylglucosamine 3-dehydrogenase